MIYKTDDHVFSAKTGKPTVNWPIFYVCLFTIVLFILAIVKLYNYSPKEKIFGIKDPKLKGISGWLILLAFFIVAQPLYYIYNLVNLVPLYYYESWIMLSVPGSDVFHAQWAPMLLFQLVTLLGMILFSILL